MPDVARSGSATILWARRPTGNHVRHECRTTRYLKRVLGRTRSSPPLLIESNGLVLRFRADGGIRLNSLRIDKLYYSTLTPNPVLTLFSINFFAVRAVAKPCYRFTSIISPAAESALFQICFALLSGLVSLKNSLFSFTVATYLTESAVVYESPISESHPFGPSTCLGAATCHAVNDCKNLWNVLKILMTSSIPGFGFSV